MAINFADTQKVEWTLFDPSLNLNTVISLTAWVNLTSLANLSVVIERFESSFIFYRLQIDDITGKLQFQKREGLAANLAGQWSSGSALSLNTLYHVATVHDFGAFGNTPALYINGVSQSITTDTAPGAVGTRPNGGTLFLGHATSTLAPIGNVFAASAFSRLLTASEILNAYNSKLVIPNYNGLSFCPNLSRAEGLPSFDGSVLGSSNFIYDQITGAKGIPSASPIGRADNALVYQGVN